jgi:hypothetical protein
VDSVLTPEGLKCLHPNVPSPFGELRKVAAGVEMGWKRGRV